MGNGTDIDGNNRTRAIYTISVAITNKYSNNQTKAVSVTIKKHLQ